MFHIFMAGILIIYIILCQGYTRNILILDIDDQGTTYVYASNGT